MWKFLPLLWANLRRRRVRTLLTIGSVAIAFLLYGMLEAFRHALLGGVEMAGADRLMTMHKVSFIQSLPRSYLNRIRGIDGVRVALSMGWFGGYYQNARNVIVVQVVDHETMLDVYPEILVSATERQAWLGERTGALVGRALASANGWKIGDHIPMRSNIYRKADGGDTWDLVVSGIYDMKDNGDTSGLFFRYDYFNESLQFGRDRAGWVVMRIRDPARMAQIARQIDAMFANSNTETKTSDERAFMQAFINQFGNIGAIITAIVSAVFFTMLLVTANTMAQAIRERTAELAVMKTLGFTGRQMLTLVLTESVLVTSLGGAMGLVLATVVVNGARASLQQYLPMLNMTASAYLSAVVLILLLGLLSGAVPAWQAWRLNIVTALRRS
jgi:putative ABC transport system permease protein